MLRKNFIKNKNFIRINLLKNYRFNLKNNVAHTLKQNYLLKSENYINKNTYASLVNFFVKKGKKQTVEKFFKKSVEQWILKGSKQNFSLMIDKAFINTKPFVGVVTKRKGSKNIYIPQKLSSKRSLFTALKWIRETTSSNQKFFENFVEELNKCSLKTSIVIKKREELLKLAEDNLSNLKKKSKI